MDQKLADLLDKKRKQSKPDTNIDWDDRRNKYLEAVRTLYARIEEWLAGPINDGVVKVRRNTKNLSEIHLGTYAADDLTLYFGDEPVRFSPRGRNILGAEGRVDVVGERGEATLILSDAEWRQVQARQPRLQVVSLTESVFADILNLVMRD